MWKHSKFCSVKPFDNLLCGQLQDLLTCFQLVSHHLYTLQTQIFNSIKYL